MPKKFLVSIETTVEVNDIENDFEAKCVAEKRVQDHLDKFAVGDINFTVVDLEQEDE